MPRLLRGLAGLAGFLLLWEVAVRTGLLDATFVAPPSVELPAVVRLLGDVSFLRDLIASVLAWLIGLGIAVVAGIPAGLLLGSIPGLRVATAAIVEFLRPIPIAALIPLLTVVIGSGPEAKITLAVYGALWPIMFNTIYALTEIDPVLMETARACGTGKVRMLTSVALPHAAPFIFTGIRLSATIALIAVVSTELQAGSQHGVGSFILTAGAGAIRLDLVLAGTIVVGVIGLLINAGLERLGKRLFRWSTVERAVAA